MFSGLTEGEIVVNSTSVGNIGENILPTTIDVIKVFKNIDSGTEK